MGYKIKAKVVNHIYGDYVHHDSDVDVGHGYFDPYDEAVRTEDEFILDEYEFDTYEEAKAQVDTMNGWWFNECVDERSVGPDDNCRIVEVAYSVTQYEVA